MSDIVERLCGEADWLGGEIAREAAAVIEKLRAENAQLRALLADSQPLSPSRKLARVIRERVQKDDR
jgi:protease II